MGKEQDVNIKNNGASCKLRVGEELKKSAIDRVENHEFKRSISKVEKRKMVSCSWCVCAQFVTLCTGGTTTLHR